MRFRPEKRGPLTVWRQPDPSRSYVIGADTGGGKAADDWCSYTVLEADTRNQCASFRRHMEADDFAHEVVKAARYWRGADGSAFVVPEANNHGLVVVVALREAAVERIYTRSTWDAVEKKFVPQLGFATSAKTRPLLIGRAREALKTQAVDVRDPQLFEEMSTFVIGDAGREDHLDGCNDDVLFGWMLALVGCAAVQLGEQERPAAPVARGPDAWLWDRVAEMKRGGDDDY